MNTKSKYTNKDITHKFDFQSRLGFSIQGKRGGTPQVKDDIGCIISYIDNPNGYELKRANAIRVDAFQGQGDTYERRDKSNITIFNKGDIIFNGDFNQLANKLLSTDIKTSKIEPIDWNNVLE